MRVRIRRVLICLYSGLTVTFLSPALSAESSSNSVSVAITGSHNRINKQIKKNNAVKNNKDSSGDWNSSKPHDLPWQNMFYGVAFLGAMIIFYQLRARSKSLHKTQHKHDAKIQSLNNQIHQLNRENEKLKIQSETQLESKEKGKRFEEYVVKKIHQHFHGVALTGKVLMPFRDQNNTDQKWIFTEWRGDKFIENGRLWARSNTLPDLEFQHIEDQARVLIECKYLETWHGSSEDQFNLVISKAKDMAEKIKRAKGKFGDWKKKEKQETSAVRIYFYLGVGGMVNQDGDFAPNFVPEEEYIFPVKELKLGNPDGVSISKSELKNHNLTLDEVFSDKKPLSIAVENTPNAC